MGHGLFSVAEIAADSFIVRMGQPTAARSERQVAARPRAAARQRRVAGRQAISWRLRQCVDGSGSEAAPIVVQDEPCLVAFAHMQCRNAVQRHGGAWVVGTPEDRAARTAFL